MAVGLKSDPGGLSGALTVNGVDAVQFDATGIMSINDALATKQDNLVMATPEELSIGVETEIRGVSPALLKGVTSTNGKLFYFGSF